MARLVTHGVAPFSARERALLQSAGEVFWRWYVVHQDDKVLSVKLPLIGSVKTIRVRDLKFLFVAIFGAPEVVS